MDLIKDIEPPEFILICFLALTAMKISAGEQYLVKSQEAGVDLVGVRHTFAFPGLSL